MNSARAQTGSPAGSSASGAQPSFTTAEWASFNWTNQTYYATPPASPFGGASVTYDPLLQELVGFGFSNSYDCSLACPSNSTWIYDNLLGWYNITYGSGYAPWLTGASVAWDPEYQGILLTGGFNYTGYGYNQTWVYGTFGDLWVETDVGGLLDTVVGVGFPGLGYGQMAYDGALQGMVYVDGCVFYSDTDCVNITMYETHGEPWYELTGGPGGNDGYLGGQMAYDPQLGEMVYFGGYHTAGGDGYVPENYTYLLTDGGTWVNITDTDGGYTCIFIICYLASPQPDIFGSMTWDGQIGAIVSYGGLNASFDVTNQTWIFNYGYWYPAWYFSGNYAIGGTEPEYGGIMPNNCTNISAVLIDPVYRVSGQMWVLEIPANVTITSVTPTLVDENETITVTTVVASGTGSGPDWMYGLTLDSYLVVNYSSYFFDVNFSTPSLTWQSAFNSTVNGTIYFISGYYDFFGVLGISNEVSAYVNSTLAVAPTPNVAETEIQSGSATVNFSPGRTGGVGPFDYAWSLGGGVKSTLPAPSETYTAAGTYHVYLNVTDSFGEFAKGTTTVVVYPQLTATPGAAPVATDLGKTVDFTGTPGGGTGTYSSYHWAFGNGATSTVQSPTYTYGATGTYTVWFNVTDSLGFTASSKLTVTINPLPTGTLTASTLTPTTATSVTFTATPTAGTGTAPFTYAWNFGDGTTVASGTASESHTYGSTGTYTVTVTITDAAGNTVVKTLTETVSKAPSSLVSDLTSGTGLYALLAVVAVVIIAIAAIALRRRKKPVGSSPPPPAPWSEGAPGTPAGGGPSGTGTPPAGGPTSPGSGGGGASPPAGAM